MRRRFHRAAHPVLRLLQRRACTAGGGAEPGGAFRKAFEGKWSEGDDAAPLETLFRSRDPLTVRGESGALFKDLGAATAAEDEIDGEEVAHRLRPLEDFGFLSERSTKALHLMGISKLFPVQAEAFEPVLSGKSTQICSPTGTGKTLAYIIPIVQRLQSLPPAEAYYPHTIVLVPTKELCLQTAKEFLRLSQLTLAVVSLMGGTSLATEESGLQRGADVVVCTMGKLAHHMESGHLKVDRVVTIVVDEGDMMLVTRDSNVVRLMETLCLRDEKNAGNPTQGIVVSATQPAWLKELHRLPLFSSYERVVMKSKHGGIGNDLISHEAISYGRLLVGPLVSWLIQDHLEKNREGKVIVFSNSRIGVRTLSSDPNLAKLMHGKPTLRLTGEDPPHLRQKVINRFNAGHVSFLVASDVLSRGITIDNLTMVINAEIPLDVSTYLYRAGRVGRQGKRGKVVTILSPGDRSVIEKIASEMKTPIVVRELTDAAKQKLGEDVRVARSHRSRFGSFSSRAETGAAKTTGRFHSEPVFVSSPRWGNTK
ncbi:DEAD-box ATP-dependent RNA helicase 53 [Diplonema papillatum]|nr:DEAD-box ATP-dependent RNA helicase 53 [Diplonema papillatum]